MTVRLVGGPADGKTFVSVLETARVIVPVTVGMVLPQIVNLSYVRDPNQDRPHYNSPVRFIPEEA